MDRLRILASTDCGITYTDTVFNEPDRACERAFCKYAVGTTQQDWESRSINLTSLAGESEVRIAFVFSNGNGNNIYIDNIEFFVSETHLPISGSVAVYPNTCEV